LDISLLFDLKLQVYYTSYPMDQHAVAFAWGNDKYYGTQATFNLWQPTVESAKHFSLAQLWITSGSYSNNDLNTIEVGWEVRPKRDTSFQAYPHKLY